ncbi:MAG: PD-(D/E)XK nuclease family protein [Candidatus Parvarchaeum sp.]
MIMTLDEIHTIMYDNPYKARKGEAPDIFYVSTLARSVQAEFDRKMNPQVPSSDNNQTMYGKALHKYLQDERFARHGFQKEISIAVKIPADYTFDNVHVTEMTLVGYADLYLPEKNLVIELKTTTGSKALIDISMKMQLALYVSALEQKLNTPLDGQVLRISAREESLYALSREEITSYSQTIIERALEVAGMLDGKIMQHNVSV